MPGLYHDAVVVLPVFRGCVIGGGLGDFTLDALAFGSTFGPQMPVESVHARKGLLASFARVRPDVKMQCLVSLAVVLSCKALVAPGPLALERPLFVVRSNVTSKIEVAGKGAAASRNRTLEIGLSSASVGAGLSSGGGSDMHSFDGLGQRDASVRTAVIGKHTWARMWTMVRARTVGSAPSPLMTTSLGANATFIMVSRHTGRNRHRRRGEGSVRDRIQLAHIRSAENSRDVLASSVAHMTSAITAIPDGAGTLATRDTEHGIDGVVPERSTDSDVEIGYAIGQDVGRVNGWHAYLHLGAALAVGGARPDGRRQGGTPLAGWGIAVAA